MLSVVFRDIIQDRYSSSPLGVEGTGYFCLVLKHLRSKYRLPIVLSSRFFPQKQRNTLIYKAKVQRILKLDQDPIG